MDKIAIISDIHGNKEALLTVLKDIKKRNIKYIYCLGDVVAKGNHALECVEIVKDNCDIFIKGNCEEYFFKEHNLDELSEIEKERILWNQKQFPKEIKDYLRSLPYCYEFYLSGRLIRIIHAHPNNIHKAVGNLDTLETYKDMFKPGLYTSDQYADICIYGHIHLPYMQKVFNRILLNPGSVGNGIDIYRDQEIDGLIENTICASYLILKGKLNSRDASDNIGYEFVSLDYNIDIELLDNDKNIEPIAYENELRLGKYRDIGKIKTP